MRIPPAILVLGLLVSAAGATSGGAGAHAGDPAGAARPAFHVTTNRDGLPQSAVTVLALDGDGYLWAGTQDGAAGFDGREGAGVRPLGPGAVVHRAGRSFDPGETGNFQHLGIPRVPPEGIAGEEAARHVRA